MESFDKFGKKEFTVKIDYKTYALHSALVGFSDMTIEETLSALLCKYTEILIREGNKDGKGKA